MLYCLLQFLETMHRLPVDLFDQAACLNMGQGRWTAWGNPGNEHSLSLGVAKLTGQFSIQILKRQTNFLKKLRLLWGSSAGSRT